MATKKTKKVIEPELTVTPEVESEESTIVETLSTKKAVEAGKIEAQQAVEVLEGLIKTMNDLGLAIEPKIYMKLEEAKKKL